MASGRSLTPRAVRCSAPDAAGSARCNRARLRLIEVAIAGFAAGGTGLAGASSSAGSGSRRLLPRTIAGPASATGFRFRAGRLGR